MTVELTCDWLLTDCLLLCQIGVQMMMLRTKHNAAVFARLQRQQKCIEEEFRAMQKFIKIDDVEPAIPDDDE